MIPLNATRFLHSVTVLHIFNQINQPRKVSFTEAALDIGIPTAIRWWESAACTFTEEQSYSADISNLFER